MGEALILEKTFLLDLERELARGSPGPAQQFLEANEDATLHTIYTIAGQLAAGAFLSDRDRWRDFVAPFRILPFSEDVAWQYGQSQRYLKEQGLLIGTNDLWIAATALAHGVPLATRNPRHFSRVPGLKIAGYRGEEGNLPRADETLECWFKGVLDPWARQLGRDRIATSRANSGSRPEATLARLEG